MGEFAATNLVEGLKKEGRTTANIFVVTGAQVQPEVAVRMDGFKSVMDKYPEYKIVDIQDGNWDQGKTADIARTLFAKYADKGGIQGAFGMADHQAAGIIEAAQQAGIPVGVDKNGLVVVGSNCFKIGTVNIGNGLQYGSATQAADPTAAFVFPLLEKALAGQDDSEAVADDEGEDHQGHPRQVPGILQRRVSVARCSVSSVTGNEWVRSVNARYASGAGSA